MKKLKSKRVIGFDNDDDEFEEPVRKAAKVSTQETMKELALQKEDTTMKKVIAQMMLMKKIQKKKKENNKLGVALIKLAERRKIINAALKKQKRIADEKRRAAQLELERQKKVMREREELLQRVREEEERREREEREEKQRREKERKESRKKRPQVNQKLQLLTKLRDGGKAQQSEVAVKAQLLEVISVY